MAKQPQPLISYFRQSKAVDHPEFRSFEGKKVSRVDNETRTSNVGDEPNNQGDCIDCQVLQSRYRAIRTILNEEKEDLCRPDSDRLQGLIDEVEYLYKHDMSFLVKDGRANIAVDDNGTHLVSPRNAPSSSLVTSREVDYSHFVFRLDFEDWKLMVEAAKEEEQLMPHRYKFTIPICKAEDVPALMPVAIPISPRLKNGRRELN